MICNFDDYNAFKYLPKLIGKTIKAIYENTEEDKFGKPHRDMVVFRFDDESYLLIMSTFEEDKYGNPITMIIPNDDPYIVERSEEKLVLRFYQRPVKENTRWMRYMDCRPDIVLYRCN